MYMLWVWSDILHGDWTGAKYYWDLAARRGCKWAQENRTRLGNTGSRATTAPEPASVGPGTPTAPKAPRGPVAGSGLAR